MFRNIFPMLLLGLALLMAGACSDDAEEGDKDSGQAQADLGTGGDVQAAADMTAMDSAAAEDTQASPDSATGPTLSDQLEDNCFDWPTSEFTPASHAQWITSLKKGDLAVDFTLEDTAGNSHTLSQLLASRPVWIQLGSFT